ncbi:hypothetical protein [Brevibacillus laterosporus]|uniref:hypothetical protein n=1 Tax=Brevibacillus laterosporus TaxID=1465 RepID=UPI003D18FF0B
MNQSDRMNYMFTYLDKLIELSRLERNCDELIHECINEIKKELRIPNAKQS